MVLDEFGTTRTTPPSSLVQRLLSHAMFSFVDGNQSRRPAKNLCEASDTPASLLRFRFRCFGSLTHLCICITPFIYPFGFLSMDGVTRSFVIAGFVPLCPFPFFYVFLPRYAFPCPAFSRAPSRASEHLLSRRPTFSYTIPRTGIYNPKPCAAREKRSTFLARASLVSFVVLLILFHQGLFFLKFLPVRFGILCDVLLSGADNLVLLSSVGLSCDWLGWRCLGLRVCGWLCYGFGV